MSFTPTEFDDSMNVASRKDVWSEFSTLVIGAVVAIVALYFVLGFAVDFVADRITPAQEVAWFGKGAEMIRGTDSDSSEAQKLQAIFDKIPASAKPKGYRYQLVVMPDKKVNAFAFPGGLIGVTHGLLSELKSENAIVFVLGHELGHFANRDHLRGMGRHLVFGAAKALLSGGGDSAGSFSSIAFDGLSLNYSRAQESTADIWGLKALVATYGHAGGATEFFEYAKTQQDSPLMERLFSTHPVTNDRIKAVDVLIDKAGYARRDVVPLAPISQE